MNRITQQNLFEEISSLKNQLELLSGLVQDFVKANDEILSSLDAAKYLGISTGALRQLVFKGKLLPRKFEDGRKNYFLKSDIISMLQVPENIKNRGE